MTGVSRGVRRSWPPRRTADGGFVVLEAAMVIPLLLLVALTALGVARVALTELAVADAARDAALASARGSAGSTVAAEVRRRLPAAEVSISRDATAVLVVVTARTSPVPMLGPVSVHHRSAASAALEPGL